MRRALLALLLFSPACMVGPNYKRPPAPVPPAYKEQPPPEFKEYMRQATPMEGAIRGKWWEVYHDPALNALEEQVSISNQNVLAAEAQYREARAAVKVARSALFPTLTTAPTANYSSISTNLGAGVVSSGGIVGGGAATAIRQTYTLPFDFSWELDIWGGIRRSIAAATDTAQTSAADLENAKLSYQAAVAEDYFAMHGLDARAKLLADSVMLYQQSLDLTQARFRQGVAAQTDVALAQTQLETTRAQLIDVGVQRSAYEHAIAILTGRPPAELTIPEVPWITPPPPVPVGVPSALLQRRPDIAAAERAVAAANEEIGVATAAYYPTLTLTGVAGLESSLFQKLFSWSSHFWSAGPQAAETILDFGRRRGTLQETQAAYDFAAATYRQTVLSAFQQVEDNLAALRILDRESVAEDAAVKAAQQSLDLTMAQYRQGLVDYINVLTAQTVLLGNQATAIGILSSRMVASVMLIEALGGGWDASQLPHR